MIQFSAWSHNVRVVVFFVVGVGAGGHANVQYVEVPRPGVDIRAVPANLPQSHARSQPHLPPTPQLMATLVP